MLYGNNKAVSKQALKLPLGNISYVTLSKSHPITNLENFLGIYDNQLCVAKY